MRPQKTETVENAMCTIIPSTITAALVAAGLWMAFQAGRFDPAGMRVIDGDTVAIAGETMRLIGIDVPEERGRVECVTSLRIAQAARAKIEAMKADARSGRYEHDGKDRLGRTLAHVTLDGQDIAEKLLADGLAKLWNGRGRPPRWCGRNQR